MARSAGGPEGAASDVGSSEWIVREGQALARLSHPHVVGIHEVAEADGHVYLAMEFVEGQTLKTWLQQKRRPATEILRAFLQAARGLMAAHDAGLVHRDFKPDNVLMGKDGRARVSDFGIAFAAGRESPADSLPPTPPGNLLNSPLTQQGSVIGTPAFMSPEQFEGQALTPLSDQWSFSVALYQALYGTHPFSAEDHRQLSQKVLNEPPAPPPSETDAPSWLEPILLRALTRDPAARFPSMAALVKAIEENLPRDPEMDPTSVLRERLILSGVFVTLLTATAVMYLTEAGTRLLTSPTGLVEWPAVMCAVMASFLVLRRRRLLRNAYGRQLAAVASANVWLLLLHHLVALRMQLPPAVIVTEDLMLLTAFWVLVACTLERWIGFLGVATGLATVATAAGWVSAPTAFGVSGLVNVGAMGIRLYLDRNLRAEPE